MSNLDKIREELKSRGKIVLVIKASPGRPRTEILEIMSDWTLKVAIAAPPVKGQANEELLKFLDKEFGGRARILRGLNSSKKLVEIVN